MNLLVTGAWQGYKDCEDQIINNGHSPMFMQFEKDALPISPEWVEGIICNGLFLNHQIEQFTNLKYIQLTSAGYDRVPMKYIKEHNIEIHNAKGVYGIPMAEYAICSVLQLYKQASFFRDNQKKHQWEKHRGLLELSGKIVCIVGCGDVGMECAKRFQAFGCKTIGIATKARKQDYFDEVYSIQYLDDVIKEADIVILAVPLNEDTRNMFNIDRFHMMKNSAVIVNIARGAVIDSAALELALQKKQIYGAVLDVFEEEPLSENSPLWDMKNVIITPHNSFVGEHNRKRLNEVICRNLMG